MRALFVLIVVAAIAYLGWVFRAELRDRAARIAPAVLPAKPTPARPVPPHPPVEVVPRIAPPGTFYVLERVVVETKAGVKALKPGDEVKLMFRHKDGRMLVTTGRDEFTVKPSVLTQDRVEAARAAAK